MVRGGRGYVWYGKGKRNKCGKGREVSVVCGVGKGRENKCGVWCRKIKINVVCGVGK